MQVEEKRIHLLAEIIAGISTTFGVVQTRKNDIERDGLIDGTHYTDRNDDYGACVYSLERKVEEAIENLQQAIDLDPKWRELAKTDPSFGNIRQNQQFQALVRQ